MQDKIKVNNIWRYRLTENSNAQTPEVTIAGFVHTREWKNYSQRMTQFSPYLRNPFVDDKVALLDEQECRIIPEFKVIKTTEPIQAPTKRYTAVELHNMKREEIENICFDFRIEYRSQKTPFLIQKILDFYRKMDNAEIPFQGLGDSAKQDVEGVTEEKEE